MSMISKICNLNHFKTILSLVTSNINREIAFAEANVERYYSKDSKRFSYCENCNLNRKCEKPRNKPRSISSTQIISIHLPIFFIETPNRCPAPGGRCVPFQNTDKKRSKKKSKKDKNLCSKIKCTPGMKNKCDGSEFPHTCTLTSGHRQVIIIIALNTKS